MKFDKIQIKNHFTQSRQERKENSKNLVHFAWEKHCLLGQNKQLQIVRLFILYLTITKHT